MTEVKENGGGAVVVSANYQNGFTFSLPTAPPVSSTSDKNDHTSILALAPAKDSDDSLPVFKAPSVTFLPPALLEPKPASPFAPKSEALNISENISSSTADPQLKVSASDTDEGKNKTDNEVKQNGGDTEGTLDTINSAVSTTISNRNVLLQCYDQKLESR